MMESNTFCTQAEYFFSEYKSLIQCCFWDFQLGYSCFFFSLLSGTLADFASGRFSCSIKKCVCCNGCGDMSDKNHNKNDFVEELSETIKISLSIFSLEWMFHYGKGFSRFE